MRRIKRLTAIAVANCILTTGCATPPAFVSATTATPEMDLRFESIECSRLGELLAIEQRNEIQMADEMSGRAAKQLLLNTIGVAALALSGYGMAYGLRGEGYKREALATSRGEIEVMKKVVAEKRCRPDGSTALILTEAPLNVQNLAITIPTDSAAVTAAELAQLGGSNCADDASVASPDVYLKRGRLLASLNQYQPAMQCLLRAVDIGKGTVVYRESCEFIATMYEFGWGVDKSVDTAKLWLQKAAM